MSEGEWYTASEAWDARKELLQPGIEMMCYRRPSRPHVYSDAAWVYVYHLNAAGGYSRNIKTVYLEPSDPLIMECLVLEFRKEFGNGGT